MIMPSENNLKYIYYAFGIIAVIVSTYILSTIEIDKTYNLVVVGKMKYSEYFQNIKEGAEIATNDYDVEVQFIASDDNLSTYEQIDLIKHSVEENVDALIIDPIVSGELEDLLLTIQSNGVKIISINNNFESGFEDYHVGINYSSIAHNLALQLESSIDEIGNILIIGSENYLENSRIKNELIDYFEENTKINVTMYECKDDINFASELIKSVIIDYDGDIAGIISLDSSANLGTAKAIEELGSNIVLVSFANTVQEIEYIDKGIISTEFFYNPFVLGYLGVEVAYDVLENQKQRDSYYISELLIDSDNIYDKDYQKILFPVR